MSIAFRVDKSNLSGSGHFYRCLNIAKILKIKNAKVKFICKKNIPSEDAKQTIKILKKK